jgi:hypothetical protein
MLLELPWRILDSLADDIEPIEEIYRHCSGDDRSVDPLELLPHLLLLHRSGFVTISQGPLEEGTKRVLTWS